MKTSDQFPETSETPLEMPLVSINCQYSYCISINCNVLFISIQAIMRQIKKYHNYKSLNKAHLFIKDRLYFSNGVHLTGAPLYIT